MPTKPASAPDISMEIMTMRLGLTPVTRAAPAFAPEARN
ncbi:unannotated protein [freshwater metagenome]|uniref:Unannotated protein n=1 Tax=freshwater metagenome TaxID=449393 RepID=A0A6J7M191_9ZZZZ